MSASSVALADAVRHIRETALRDAMAMVHRMQLTQAVDFSGDQEAYRIGHRHCRLAVCAEIERMIVSEAPAPNTQAGSTSDEEAVRRWRAHEKAAFALGPIMEREGYDRVAAGKLADAAVDAFEKAMSEPLPEGWRKYVQPLTGYTSDGLEDG